MSRQEQAALREVYVARQAVLDREQHLFGYELLYRSSRKNVFDGLDSTKATSRVISHSFMTIGLERLIADRRALINFDRNMLVSGYAAILPKKSVIVEILEDVTPDVEVVAACRKLKHCGYQLALDDFVGGDGFEPLIELADIIKVDFRLTSPSVQAGFAKQFNNRGIVMLAEKVETQQEFQRARDMGYSLFQGYFFSKPAIVTGREVPGFKLNYLRILKEINNPDLDFDRIEEIVKYEASLVHKLLRYINSATFGWNREIESIRHALALLGEKEVRKWISLVAISGLAGDKPQELVVNAVIRGRFCELMSSDIGLSQRQSELFLMGMFSLLDAVLGMPMQEILGEVHLADDVRDTLLGKAARTRGLKEVLGVVRAYETADWAAMEEIAQSVGLSASSLSQTYMDSVEWADRVFQD